MTSASVGHSHYKVTKFQKAVGCYERARKICEQLDDKEEVVNVMFKTRAAVF